MIVIYINIIILFLLIITSIAINQQDNLFAATMLTGIFSLLSASLFVCLDAVDVAFTEAAVGAGIALILFLGTLASIKYKEKVKNKVLINISILILNNLRIFDLTISFSNRGIILNFLIIKLYENKVKIISVM